VCVERGKKGGVDWAPPTPNLLFPNPSFSKSVRTLSSKSVHTHTLTLSHTHTRTHIHMHLENTQLSRSKPQHGFPQHFRLRELRPQGTDTCILYIHPNKQACKQKRTHVRIVCRYILHTCEELYVYTCSSRQLGTWGEICVGFME